MAKVRVLLEDVQLCSLFKGSLGVFPDPCPRLCRILEAPSSEGARGPRGSAFRRPPPDCRAKHSGRGGEIRPRRAAWRALAHKLVYHKYSLCQVQDEALKPVGEGNNGKTKVSPYFLSRQYYIDGVRR